MPPTTAEPPLITAKSGQRNLVRDGARHLPGVVASWWPCETESGNHWHSIESAHNKIQSGVSYILAGTCGAKVLGQREAWWHALRVNCSISLLRIALSDHRCSCISGSHVKQPAHRKSLEWFFGSMYVSQEDFRSCAFVLCRNLVTTAKETDPARGYVITITRDLANSVQSLDGDSHSQRTEPAFGDGNGISDRTPIAFFNPRYNLQISDHPTRTGAIAITAS
ncbi:hypothetical protein MYCTH_95413 [Thermothelomyces thermophilus ATCC 42464]|uniref:Uncharacterized protein n=1 Tax=Thermothelomyces thermophilus (strain ATCC 42464 / BCRC 31852 / DSM 1799) TaxID=573729 RepID=G2QFV0_THET4|nr:uncharacterized protein MYCTH_95413 [Thermothelomyces thermophilus ATCC 42464]AEO58468.1 hypothetical protein MYCTH_95413 [Thermothelomyces thermophilus ATCC 42464]